MMPARAGFFMKIFNKMGFSLIELLIVLAIMGIVSAITAPNFMNYMAERRLNGAARMVMSDLMAARQKAVSQNNEFKVFFDASNHQYTILDDDDNDGAADGGEATDVRDIQVDYYDVTFSASANPIFYPRGTAWGTKVTLTSSRTGVSKYVKVASTGRVKIDDTL
jgi:type IV fimbrial biogenesis protein FimT